MHKALEKYRNLNLNERHAKQVLEMIGKKVKVYFGVEGKITRVLKQDYEGLYVMYQGQRIPCRPDTNTLNVMFFIGLHPKLLRRLQNN